MNQWMQEQPIQGTDLKGMMVGVGICVRLCVCVRIIVVVLLGRGGLVATMHSLVASNGEQAWT